MSPTMAKGFAAFSFFRLHQQIYLPSLEPFCNQARDSYAV